MHAICLHGIVCNEATVIQRMLNSVRSFVTEYYIVDTGSSDNTTDIISSDKLHGTISHNGFTDFSTTRNHALGEVLQKTVCAWIMLMDADMIFHGHLSTLVGDVVKMTHVRNGLRYLRITFIRTHSQYKYEGKTHEILHYPDNTIVSVIPETQAWIEDGGDGGNNADKLSRDARLLSTATTPREVFYLAETQRYMGNPLIAIQAYKRRITLGGSHKEELFYSCYQIGRLCLSQQRAAEARHWMDRSLSYNPKRAEPHYHLACWSASRQRWNNAIIDIMRSLSFPKKADTSWLFVEIDVYNFLRAYQFLVIASKTECLSSEACLDKAFRLIADSNVPDIYKQNIHDTILPSASPRISLTETLFHKSGVIEGNWRWSTPTFLNDITLIRSNDYYVSHTGEYLWSQPDHCECRVFALAKNGDLHAVKRTLATHPLTIYPDRRIRGLEDVRLFDFGEQIGFTAIVEDMIAESGKRRIVVGKFDTTANELEVEHVLESPYDKDCEKNWAFFVLESGNIIHCVYQWWPLEVGTVHGDRLIDLRTTETCDDLPSLFRWMRGSSHGQYYNNLIWFITHSVALSDRKIRHYLHYCVALCPRTLRVIGYSPPFRFTDGPVEFCTGFSIEKNNGSVKLGFSCNDSSTTIAVTNTLYSFLGRVGFRYISV